jgi:CRP-like cAMP-binding protein
MASTSSVNLLLETLHVQDRKALLAQCETVNLVVGAVLSKADLVTKYVYFPLSGFISLVTTVKGHPPVATGLIGNEGMLGATLRLNVKTDPIRGVVQGAGTALRIKAPQFRLAMKDHPRLRRTINRYLYVWIAQLSHGITCTHFHEVESRLARWLLMVHDRTNGDKFHLTHSFLAEMLGVQRSAVTIAAGGFQKRQLIRYTRGEITVLDRQGLEIASCGCYDVFSSDYTNQFPLDAA